MGLFHSTSTALRSAELYVTYTCSVCDAQNLVQHSISAGGSGGAFGFISESRLDAKEKASSDAGGRLIRKLLDICEEREEGKYRTAQFRCKCGKCGNKEPWARMRYMNITAITAFLALIGLLAVFYLCCISRFTEAAVIGGAVLVVLAAYWTYRIIHTCRMEALTAQLPPESHPAFSQEFDEVKALAAQRSRATGGELFTDRKIKKIMKGRSE